MEMVAQFVSSAGLEG